MSAVSTGTVQQGWSRADKISLFAALIAVIAAAAPYAVNGVHYLNRPRVTINSPANGARESDNTFGAGGTASNIPGDSDLWIVVQAGVEGRWYPNGRLRIINGKWSVGNRLLCPGDGPQNIEIYMVSDTGESGLFDYINGPGFRKGTGVSSMPPGAILEATSQIRVNANGSASC